jgi:hypothetical protein
VLFAGLTYFKFILVPIAMEIFVNYCPGRSGRLSALSDFLCKSVLYGAFVWARRPLKHQKRRFPARAVLGPLVDLFSRRPIDLCRCARSEWQVYYYSIEKSHRTTSSRSDLRPDS